MDRRHTRYEQLQLDFESDKNIYEAPHSSKHQIWRALVPRMYTIGLHTALVLLLIASFMLVVGYRQLNDQQAKTQSYLSMLQKEYTTTKSHMHRERSSYGITCPEGVITLFSLLILFEAGLVAEVSATIYEATPYNDYTNVTLQDQLWMDIGIDPGIVALSDEYATEKGSPLAQRFPWDESKGLYLLNGYHHLHCLVGTMI